MILISHRGNIDGKDPKRENSPLQISDAVVFGFDVEVDLRGHNGKIYLGHDEPQYKVGKHFINEFSKNLWVHCKDRYALEYAMEHDLNFFYHQKDDYTITSKGYLWAYPGIQEAGNKTICVLPELFFGIKDLKNRSFIGYCSDTIAQVRNELNHV